MPPYNTSLPLKQAKAKWYIEAILQFLLYLCKTKWYIEAII